jgi:hypothetical protein
MDTKEGKIVQNLGEQPMLFCVLLMSSMNLLQSSMQMIFMVRMHL